MGKITDKLKDAAREAALSLGVLEYVDENGRPIKQKRQPRRTRQPVTGRQPRISNRTPRLR